MKCPKCGKTMKVVRTYNAGNTAKTQNLECTDPKCGTTGTAVIFFLVVDPLYGQGAYKLAQRISDGKIKTPKIK